MSRVDRALEIKADIESILADAAIENVLVTLDTRAVEKGLFHGPVVVVQPPKIEFSTFTITDLTWDVYVVSGPTDDAVEAWRRTDDVIDAMELGRLPLDRGEPANFQGQNATYPAYILTLKETQQLVQ